MDTKEKKKAEASSQRKKAGPAKTAASAKSGASGKKKAPSGNGKAAVKRAASKPKRSVPVYTRKRPQPQRRNQRRLSQDVVYTQPEPFNRNRFLLRLLTVVAVVLALFFGMSIFFKVKTVRVSGADKYTAWEIRQASGIEEGENLLALNEAMIGGKIKTALPYISRVRVGIKLPDTVNIDVSEIAVTYAVESSRDGWWLITADGKVMEPVNSVDAEDYTRILGIRLESPLPGGTAVAKEPDPPATSAPATDASGENDETAAQTEDLQISGADQLAAALDMLQYLEDNGILGEADYVNVKDLGQLELFYADRYLVLLGDRTRLGYKIEMMANTIEQLGEHYRGTLDVSYTLRPDQVVYTPSDAE